LGFVLALSADGNTLAVSAYFEGSAATGINGNQSDDSIPQAGAVYVFTRVGTTWSQQAYLKASNAGGGDRFGASVSLSGDGSTLVVGAPFEDSDDSEANIDAGAAYIFVRVGAKWSQQDYLKASNGENGIGDGPWDGDHFGEAVAISTDGLTVAVGASSEDSDGRAKTNNDAPNSGAVYVFTRGAGGWSEYYLKAFSPHEGDHFGCALSLSANGSMLAVGAYREDSSATDPSGAPDSGAVFVFVRSGTTWQPPVKLKAKTILGGAYLGHSVALSGDGSTLAAYAPGEENRTGVVRLFFRSGTQWTQDANLKGAHAEAGDVYGLAAEYSSKCLALSADGSTLAFGAMGEGSNATNIDGDQTNNDAPNSGAIYVFHRADAWTQQTYIKAPNTSEADLFGISITLSADGSTLVAGASSEDSNATGIGGNQADKSALGSGAAHVY